MLHVVNGDLLNSNEQYIVHQCNCVTTTAAYLAHAIFEKFPYSDVYSARVTNDTPGNILIRGDGKDQRYIIALFGQYFPGFPKYADSSKDGVKARQKYFHQGLLKIAKIPSLQSVAFPYGIGCGAAGGNWDIYSRIIMNFANYLNDKVEVYIYHLDGA